MAQPRIELATMNHHYMFYDLDDFFANAQKLGYPCVELWTSPQHFFMDYRQNDPIERLSISLMNTASASTAYARSNATPNHTIWRQKTQASKNAHLHILPVPSMLQKALAQLRCS